MGSCWRPQASARAWKAESGPCCPWRSIRIRAAGTFTLWGFSLPFLRGWRWQNATWVLFPGGLQTLLSACVHVCSTPGMLKWKARHAQNNICFHTKTTLILFAFCVSGVLLLFSASIRTWNMLMVSWKSLIWVGRRERPQLFLKSLRNVPTHRDAGWLLLLSLGQPQVGRERTKGRRRLPRWNCLVLWHHF